MRLESVTAEIRPRSDWEAVDLGLALARRDFWRCFAIWWLAVLLPTVAAGWWLWDSPMLVLVLFWWWKPVGSRMVLFEISRRLFGEAPTWKASLREIPKAWVRRFFYRLVWARFSPWMPVTLAVEELEGLRGKAYQQRCGQVNRRGDGVVMWIYVLADLGACWFGMAILVVVLMCVPDGQDGAWRAAAESWEPSTPWEIPGLIMRTVLCCVMLAMSLMEIFVTGAGFGIYINNRTWIEGWDVELAFKRMAARLSKVVLPCVMIFLMLSPTPARAQEAPEPAPAPVTAPASVSKPVRVMREVKTAPEFKVHTVKQKVPVESKTSWSWLEQLLRMLHFFGSGGAWLSNVFTVSMIALLVGLIGWLVWINRHAFLRRGNYGGGDSPISPRARVVMGMDISPENLPTDVPGAALALWRRGMHQEALGLLYRGAISRVIEMGRVEIQESDTEGDCVRRVNQAGDAVHPAYFQGITGVWMRLAYAGNRPQDEEVESLCRQWPFGDRRGA
ncbi:MAG: DUF4129 domain-containing protein [Verrucomicrobiota bacterium]